MTPIVAARVGVRRNAVAAFLPTSLTGLGLWLDAGQITGATDATAVATWQDRSGNAWDAGQATASKQPVYRSTGSLLTSTGKPVVQFDGVDDCLDCTAGASAAPSQSVFVVARATSFPANPDPTYTFVASTVQGGLGFQLASTGTTIRVEDDGQAGRYLTSYSPGTTVFHQYSCMYFSDGTTGSQHIFSDGTELGAGGAVSTALTGAGFRRIGGASPAVNIKFLTGVIAEIVIYTRLLSTVERQQVEAYLKAKHGTP